MTTNAYGAPKVDLSALEKRKSAVPPPSLPVVETNVPEGPLPPPPPARRRPASEKRAATKQSPPDAKVQLFVHLPPEEHAWLRQQALDKGWPKREVILEAFVAHRDQITAHDPDVERRRQAGLPPRAPGRRKEVGGIPSNVYMARSEAEVLDNHAAELGMSRSQMVTELLRLASSSPAPAPTKRAGARRPRT